MIETKHTIIMNPSTSPIDDTLPCVIDVEWDEDSGNFVGAGITQDGKVVYYYSVLSTLGRHIGNNLNLIGHNVKSDLHQLRHWGLKVSEENMYADTIIMSYVLNTTADSHSLKRLAKQHLDMEWSSYDDMLNKETQHFRDHKESLYRYLTFLCGDDPTLKLVKQLESDEALSIWKKYRSKKCVLSFHTIEDVAEYNANDVIATWRLFHKFTDVMDMHQRKVYATIELPTLKAIFKMECNGIMVDTNRLAELTEVFGERRDGLLARVQNLAKSKVNPNSSQQLAPILEAVGVKLPLTRKGNKSTGKQVLLKHMDKTLVRVLLEYKAVEKLHSTYLEGFSHISTLPMIHSTFNQIRYNTKSKGWTGMSTNRLSSSKPNMQNIPKRGEYASLIRSLFIAPEGYQFVCGDLSQVEYRFLAHFTQDTTLLEAYRNDEDLHQKAADMVGCSRESAKQLNYAVIYGAKAPKVMELINQTLDEGVTQVTIAGAYELLQRHAALFPKVYEWKERELIKARKAGGITTFSGRFIQIPDLQSKVKGFREAAERQAINYIIQGSAAELIKLAMIQVHLLGLCLSLQVHDELIVLAKDGNAQDDLNTVRDIMENVMHLDVPIKVDIKLGRNWDEAKA